MRKIELKTKEKAKRETSIMKKLKNMIASVSGFMYSSTLMTAVAYAAEDDDKKGNSGDISAITQPLNNLKGIIIAVVGAIGVIILVKNVMEFAQAYQGQDTSGMNSALKGIVAGTMMALISTVLTILGIS